MTDIRIHYPDLIDTAMRGVVREVLRMAARHGLPGDHHFYVTFRTTAPGVRMSDVLRVRYPEEMTVVLQHQYWDFSVEDQFFNVTLSFGGVPEKLVIPFAAMTAFADPAVKFGLQFQVPASDIPATANAQAAAPGNMFEGDLGANNEPRGAAEIISLDHFRKK